MGRGRDLGALLRGMNPELNADSVAFCASDVVPDSAIGFFREREGTTVILKEAEAERRGLDIRFRAAWITLTVNSDLEAVGFLAAVTRALAETGIPCNAISAIHHDHLFVPMHAAKSAMTTLRNLQANWADT